jgi:hypothetical protein
VLLKMRRRTNATWPAGNHVYTGARLLLLGEQRPATLETTLRVRAAAALVTTAKAALANYHPFNTLYGRRAVRAPNASLP